MNEAKKAGDSLMKTFRVLGRGIAVLRCVAGALSDFGIQAAAGRLSSRRRAAILQKWSARLLSGMKVQITVDGEPPATGLIVSNHLSYLDILVFSTVAQCAFVSKREVRSWPGVGWIASLSGTIYIDRSRKSDTHAIQPKIQAALANGVRLVVFPEGTSTDGSHVLHFHSSLFQPALDCEASVTAACLNYSITDGDASVEACYWGDMRLVPHLLNLLTKQSIQARVTFSRQHYHFIDRKQAARRMQQEVESLLQFSNGMAETQRCQNLQVPAKGY